MTSPTTHARSLTATVAAQAISVVGSTAASTAISLYVYGTTGSQSILGTLIACTFVGSVLLSPIAGQVVSNFSDKFLLLTCDAAQTVLALVRLAILLLVPSAWWVATLGPLMVLIGFLGAIVSVCLIRLVKESSQTNDLMRNNAIMSVAQSAPMLLGPILGGLIYATGALHAALLLDAATFVISGLIVAATFARVPRKREGGFRNPYTGLRVGFAGIFGDKALRDIQIAYSGMNLLGGLTAAGVAALAIDTVGEAGYGFVSAGAAAAAVLAAAVAARTSWSWRVLILGGLAAGALFGRAPLVLADAEFGLPHAVAIGAVAFAFAARNFCGTVSNAPLLGVWQLAVPSERLTVVMGARRLMSQGTFPVGAVAGGLLFDSYSPTMLIAIFATIEVAIAVWLWQHRAVSTLLENSGEQ